MKASPNVSIYGRLEPPCSFTSVTTGWQHGLEVLAGATGNPELVARVVTMDQNLAESMEDPTAVAVVTDPHLLQVAKAFDHSVYYLVIAPHSPFLPEAYLATMRSMGKHLHLFPPSQYSADQLIANGFENVTVVPHGIDPAYKPLTAEEARAVKIKGEHGPRAFRGPGINFLHLAAGSIERKGTLELVEAFTRMIEAGADVTLTMILSTMDRAQVAMRTIKDERLRERLRVLPRLDAPPEKMRWFYTSFDFIIQPSRVEGFGLCPLEALACGVPVVVTQGTGHVRWLVHCGHEAVRIPMAPEAAPMAGEGNHKCPTVSINAIQIAVDRAIAGASHLKALAIETAQTKREKFSWPAALTDVF